MRCIKTNKLSLFILIGLLSLPLSSFAQVGSTFKISGNFAGPGDVISSVSSDDGLFIVYEANQERADQEDLYSVSLRNNQIIRLSGSSQGDSIVDYAVTENDNIVVYVSSDGTKGELFTSRINNGNPTKINPQTSESERVFAFKINPASSQIVYATKVLVGPESGLDRLYSIDIDGNNNVLLDSAIAFDNSLSHRIDLEFIGSSTAAAYVVGEREPNDDPFIAFNTNLFRVPLDGSSSPIQLNKTSATSNAIQVFEVSSSQQRIVFTTGVSQPRRLYSVGLNGNNETLLDTRILTEDKFAIRGNTSVTYVANFEASNLEGVFTAPINGGDVSTLYTASTTSEEIPEFRLGDQDTDVLFRIADTITINGQPRTFGAVYRHRTGVGLSLLTPLGIFPSRFALAGNNRVLITYAAPTQDPQLFVVNSDTGASSMLSDGSIIRNNFFSRDGEIVIFTERPSGETKAAVFSINIDGTERTKLSAPHQDPAPRYITQLNSIGTHLIYQTNQDTADHVELYAHQLRNLPDVGNPEADNNELCIPIKARNGGFAIVCL